MRYEFNFRFLKYIRLKDKIIRVPYFFNFKNKKESRLNQMDSFFSTVAALQSSLLRSLVENTLKDLIEFLLEYQDGNEYEGAYNFFKGLALPHLTLPFVFYFLPNRSTETIEMSPSLECTLDELNTIVDMIVDSVLDVPRIEHSLFQNVSDIELRYVNMVDKNEHCVLKWKEKLAEIVKVNSTGPQS
jgi:hypothetical protein